MVDTYAIQGKVGVSRHKQNPGKSKEDLEVGKPRRLGLRLSYPEKQDDVYAARIKFVVHEAIPLDVDFDKILDLNIFDNLKQYASGLTGTAKTDDDTAIDAEGVVAGETALQQREVARRQQQQVNKEADEAAKAVFEGVRYERDPTEDVVSMFVPLSVTFNDAVQYDQAASLGVSGAAAADALQGGAGFLGSAMAGLSEGAASIFGLAKDAGADAGRLAAIRAAQNPLTPTGVKNAVSLSVQRTLNPNTRPLFRGVTPRTFTFAFKMIATSPSEAVAVDRIVKHFRKNVYPESLPADKEISLAYKFPKVFDITFTHRGGKKLGIPNIEKCYLQNAQTVFNSTTASFHADGRPTEVDLTLTFVEHKTLDRSDIESKGM